MIAAAIAIGLSLALAGNDGLAAYYFQTEDAPTLATGGLFLLFIARWQWGSSAVPPLKGPTVALLITAAAILAWIGTVLVVQRYPLSRDEQLAEFAASYFRHGALGWRVPHALVPLAPAMFPEWSDRYTPGGWWASHYLPVNSLIRLAAGCLGDRWLAGPLLLAAGLIALWHVARRLWPTEPAAPTVTLVLALSSTQLLANAMTPYAMTAHFALTAVWLACFLRGTRTGHAIAIAVGFAAAGLHQLHFHLMVVGGFVVWSWRCGDRRLAATYAAACLAYIAIWGLGWPRLMNESLSVRPAVQPPLPLWDAVLAKVQRLNELEPVTSLSRFVAWQNVLLLPLSILGVAAVRARRAPPQLKALAIGCGFGLATMIYQGHGLGYRYLQVFIPGFCLIAAAGWVELGRRLGRPAPAALLWSASALALLVTSPFLLWRTHRFIAPYAAAYRAVRASPADVVIVDPAAGPFIRDIVRFDDPQARPMIVDLAYLPDGAVERLCFRSRVQLFGKAQAAALGIPEMSSPPIDTVARQALLRRIGCTQPVAIR